MSTDIKCVHQFHDDDRIMGKSCVKCGVGYSIPLTALPMRDPPITTGDLKMNFGEALLALDAGKKVARSGWNGVGLWLELQVPDANSKMTLPYIYINYPVDAKTTPGAKVPWLASQTDILAKDWSIVE